MLMASCKDSSNFPDTPYLRYEDYTTVKADVDPDAPFDHAVVHVYFTDGDGNVGIRDFATGEFNFVVSVFEKYDTGYAYVYDWSALLTDLADEGQQNRALEGDLYYKVNLGDVVADTARIELQLIDDDGNKSEIVHSPDIPVNF